jgi:pimeloyl-ACP methyl ester carboxylesterase
MQARIASTLLALVLFVAASPAALAAQREARVPLRDDKLDLADLSVALCREIGLPECGLGVGRVSLEGVRGSVVVAALNQALGEGCRVSVADGALVLSVDPEKLPGDCAAMSKAVRVFTAVTAPAATAAQAAFYGMFLPEKVDAAKSVVVLVHGLDCDRANWGGMAQCLTDEGYQVVYFTYPSDQPISDSAAFFAKNMATLRQAFPKTPVNVVAYSMGGLVSRAYIEGPDYAGGIERLIMIATPNRGSGWSRMRLALELQEHYHLWRHEQSWSPTWMITDGFGEAGRDLKPGSAFLKELNSRPRREGVKYTIIAGDQHPARRKAADWLECTANLVPKRAESWWGFRHYKNGLTSQAHKVRNKSSEGDGPVRVTRAKLAGVEDFVVVHADHASLYIADGKTPPAAWDTVRDRLSR